ncbi:MAG: hypothetical protein CVU56_23485 [Deltaproteobacteria bacterium HGW-Deltaproteobacteria-14]|nr:MAG: hypothetical protein CVU56_23485 [Deltaproteobacteria bacterium HGW-Deltaproteobacteria-14]
MTATTQERHQPLTTTTTTSQAPAGTSSRSRRETTTKALRTLGFAAAEELLNPNRQETTTADGDADGVGQATERQGPGDADAITERDDAGGDVAGGGDKGPGLKEQVELLLQKPQLTADEILFCRQYAETLPDGEERQQLYLELQRKAPYANQRNNQMLGQSSTSGGLDKNREQVAIGDVMCNVTALAMDLQSLGVSKSRLVAALPDPQADPAFKAFFDTQVRSYNASHEPDITKWQYEDLIELARRWYFPTMARTTLAVLSALARLVGVEMSAYASAANMKSPAHWKLLHQQAILQGKTVYLGVHGDGPQKTYEFGHIIRMQEVTEQGVVVDDPYSGFHVKQNASGNAEVTSMQKNASTAESGSGEDHTFTWADLNTSLINWIMVLATLPEREPEVETQGAGGTGGGADQIADEPLGAPIARMVVVNREALMRKGPPAFAEMGTKLALGAQVDLYKREGNYALVKDRNEAKVAWTWATNLKLLAQGDAQRTYEADVHQRMGLDQDAQETQDARVDGE